MQVGQDLKLVYTTQDVCKLFDIKLSYWRKRYSKLITPIKKGGEKHYYTNGDLIRLIDLVFPRTTPQQRAELISRFKK